MAIHELFVGHLITFQQTIKTNLIGLSVTSQLSLRQDVSLNLKYLTVTNDLGLTQKISYQRSITNLSVSSNLNLTQDVSKGPRLEVLTLLPLWHKIELVPYERVINTLNLSQIIDVWKGQGVTNQLNLTQSIVLNVNRVLSVISNLFVGHGVAVFKPDKNFVAGNYVFAPQRLTLLFGSESLELRNPEWNNVENVTQNKILRRSRGNDFIVFRDPIWTEYDVLKLTISNLCHGPKAKVLSFLNRTMGKLVRLTNHEGYTWEGFILTPAAQASEQFDNNFSIQLEFQGDLV